MTTTTQPTVGDVVLYADSATLSLPAFVIDREDGDALDLTVFYFGMSVYRERVRMDPSATTPGTWHHKRSTSPLAC